MGYKMEEKIERFFAEKPISSHSQFASCPRKWSNLTFLHKRKTFLHIALSFAVWFCQRGCLFVDDLSLQLHCVICHDHHGLH